MPAVIFEQGFTQRMSSEDLAANDARNRWCLNAYRIRPIWHLLSLDGLRVCCLLEAPDAESVRRARREAAAPPPERVWSATIHGPVADAGDLTRRFDGGQRSIVVVERTFSTPVSFDAVQAMEDRGSWCLSLHRVEFLVTHCALDRQRMLCLYGAPDAEAVNQTNTRLGLPFERIWSAVLHVCGEPAGS